MKEKKKSSKKIIVCFVKTVLVIFAALCFATVVFMRSTFSRGDYTDKKYVGYNRYDPDWKDIHPREEVTFTSGDNELKGFIYGLENTDPKGLIVFAHGIGGGHESYINQLMWFVDENWVVFAYDATGSGYSEGSGSRGLVQSALDLDKALDFAENDERLSGFDKYLLGHSWGAYAVSAVQNFDHDIKAAASMSGYAYPVEMLDVGAEQMLGKAGSAVFHPFVWSYNKLLYGEYASLNAVDGINKSGIPNLVIHGENDDFVEYDRASILSKSSRITNPNVRYITLTGEFADHNMFFNSDACNEYKKPFNERRKEINKIKNKTERNEKLEALVSEMDKDILNTINTDLLITIENFYENKV